MGEHLAQPVAHGLQPDLAVLVQRGGEVTSTLGGLVIGGLVQRMPRHLHHPFDQRRQTLDQLVRVQAASPSCELA